MNDEIVGIVEEAVRLARDLGFVSEYTRWADRWLRGPGSIQGLGSRGCRACAAMDQFRRRFVGVSLRLERRGRGRGAGAGHENSAASSAQAAIRHAGFVRNPPPERDWPRGEPELIFDDWNYGTSPRSRSYDPREV